MKMRAIAGLFLLAACGEAARDETCKILDEGDGTATIHCPTGPDVRVPVGGVDAACTRTDLPEGGQRIYCSDGYVLEIGPDGQVIFPGGGAISGSAFLLGEQGRRGIRVSAGPVATTTDDRGEFLLTGLPAGIYQVHLEYEGYAAEVETNVPAVGRVWRIEQPITLYPGHLLLEGNPSAIVFSPAQDSILLSYLPAPTSGVGPITWWDLSTAAGLPAPPQVAGFALPPGERSFRADGEMIVWVEHTDDTGGNAVVRNRLGNTWRRQKTERAVFFGDEVLVVGSADAPGTFVWNPSAPEGVATETKVSDKNLDMAHLHELGHGKALVIEETDDAGNVLKSRVWRRSDGVPQDLGNGPAIVAGGGAVGIDASGDLWGVFEDGPMRGPFLHQIRRFDESPLFLAPDGRTCITGTAPAKLYYLAAGNPPKLIKSDVTVVQQVQFAPDGSLAVIQKDTGGTDVVELRDFGIKSLTTTSPPKALAFGDGGAVVYQEDTRLWWWKHGDDATLLLDSVSSWKLDPGSLRVVYTQGLGEPLEYIDPTTRKIVQVSPRGTPDRFVVSDKAILYEEAELQDDDMTVVETAKMRVHRIADGADLLVGESNVFSFASQPLFLPGGAGIVIANEQGSFYCQVAEPPADMRVFKVENAQLVPRAMTAGMLIYQLVASEHDGVYVMYTP